MAATRHTKTERAQMLIVVQAGRWVRCWLSRYHRRISEEALDIRLQKVGLRDAMRLIHITKPSRTQHPQHTRPPRQETISLQQHNCDNGKEKKTSNKCFTIWGRPECILSCRHAATKPSVYSHFAGEQLIAEMVIDTTHTQRTRPTPQ